MIDSALTRGKQLHAKGHLDAAEACYREALAANPGDAEAGHYLAVVLMQGERQQEALALLRDLVRKPDAHADTVVLLCMLCRTMGLYAEGIVASRQVLQSRPSDPVANMLAGSLHVLIGEYPLGERYLRRATALAPREAGAWYYLGIALHRQSRWHEAIHAYEQTSKLTPADFRLYYNIGLCADALGDARAACNALREALRMSPQRVDILSRLASVEAAMCDFDATRQHVDELDRVLAQPEALQPDDQVEPFVLTFLGLNETSVATVLDRKARQTEAEAALLDRPQIRIETGHERPLRIGYLSADFGEHAVGSLIQGLFAAHDRSAVSVHAYSLRRHSGDVSLELRAGADTFRDCDALSTADIAGTIANDRIDVLIDLAGYTLGARPAVLALRPAPLQYGYLGYLHSYAADWIDGLIVDAVVAPAGVDASCREPLIRLPGTLFPGSAALPSGRGDRPRFGLPSDGTIYASFNNSYKLDPELLSAWIEIDRRVSEAYFLVYAPPQAMQNVVGFWRLNGGRSDRLLIAEKISPNDHADRAASCDLFLDAFRYQAGATGVAAAVTGLPLLTCEGSTFVSRFGASLDRFLGLDQLVCSDVSEYIDRAVAIGRDEALREALKAQLREAVVSTGLLNPSRTARALEHTMRAEWVKSCAKLKE